MKRTQLFIFALLLSALSSSSDAGQGINEIRQALSGSPDSPPIAAFLQEAGISDPGSIRWRYDVEQLEVETWMRFRDVDRDGNPEMFLALHDQKHVHWFLFRPDEHDGWGRPLYLQSTGIVLHKSENMNDWLDSACPRSYFVSGRVLIYALAKDMWDHERADFRYMVWQLADDKFQELIAEEVRDRASDHGEWWAMSAGVPGEVHFFRWSESFQDGARLVHRRKLLPGEDEVGPPEELTFDHVEKIRPHNEPSNLPPKIDDTMHPAVLAFELGRDRRKVLESDLWDRIKLDPKQYRLFDLRYETEYPIQTSVCYVDIDEDGSLEAWVILQYLARHYWMLMDCDRSGDWKVIGMKGGLWIEHPFGEFDNNPPLPETHHLSGCTFVVISSGSTHDLGAEIHDEVFLFENGSLTSLWKEVVFGHEFDSQRLSFTEGNGGGIRFEVVTYDGWSFQEDQIKQRRVWTLAPGETELRRVDE